MSAFTAFLTDLIMLLQKHSAVVNAIEVLANEAVNLLPGGNVGTEVAKLAVEGVEAVINEAQNSNQSGGANAADQIQK